MNADGGKIFQLSMISAGGEFLKIAFDDLKGKNLSDAVFTKKK